MKKVKKGSAKKGIKVQSLHFAKDFFTKAQAKAWAKKHGFVYAKVDTTPHEHRIRQYPPRNIRVVGQKELADGVFGIFGFPKSGYSF